MSRTPLPRPTLLPGLPRVWRSAHTLQLGLDPRHAVLLDLPEPRAAQLLDLLDGSRSERLAVAQAAPLGFRPEEARALLDTLHAAGLVVPAQSLYPPAMPERLTAESGALAFTKTTASPARALRRRASARIVVTGPSKLAAGVAVALAAGGIGHVHPDLTGSVGRHEPPGGPLTSADIGTPRAQAVAAAIQQAAPETRTRPVRRGAASLVIQLGGPRPAVSSTHRTRPHLTATVREGVAVLGPLVPPGATPCLNCIALHRRDRDADWPHLPVDRSPATVEAISVATLLAAVAYVTGEALNYLDGGTPETLGAELEISGPGHTRRRTWPPHPSCACTRRRRPLSTGRDRANETGSEGARS